MIQDVWIFREGGELVFRDVDNQYVGSAMNMNEVQFFIDCNDVDVQNLDDYIDETSEYLG